MKNTAAALRTAGGLIVQRLSQGLNENNSTASGELDSSIEFNVRSGGKGVEMNITMLDYWEFVDQGRKAGKRPPISSIQNWLTYPNVKDKVGVSSLTEQQTRSLAYIIAKRIGDKGTKGNDFATNVFNSRLITTDLPETVGNAAYEDLDLLMSELISNIE